MTKSKKRIPPSFQQQKSEVNASLADPEDPPASFFRETILANLHCVVLPPPGPLLRIHRHLVALGRSDIAKGLVRPR
ncbi:hypothetical protein NL676_016141 [Syzygium grande]|nr:hypothetical protein NL676_016141 [Syzygium grande]